jgi:hypothetical protein
MSDRDFSQLDVGQLCSIYDNLGSPASDFKNALIEEIVNRLFEKYPAGVPVPEESPDEDFEALQKVKDTPIYRHRVNAGFQKV